MNGVVLKNEQYWLTHEAERAALRNQMNNATTTVVDAHRTADATDPAESVTSAKEEVEEDEEDEPLWHKIMGSCVVS